jgi:Mg-chelatase subunit ChlD
MPSTAIGLVVDRSGSMGSLRAEAQNAVNQFIKDQKAESGKAFLLLTDFDDQFRVVKPLTNLKSIEADYELEPRGTTALYDAVAKTVQSLEEGIKSKKNPPEQAVMVVVTDGYENASQEYKSDDLKSLIESKKSDGWEFIFLAAGQDAILEAGKMGIGGGTSLTYDTANYGQTVAMASTSVSSYRATANMDSFTDADRKKAVDTTSGS